MSKLSLGIAILALVIAGVAMFKSPSSPTIDEVGGLTHNQKESFVEGLYAGQNRVFEVDRLGEIHSTKNPLCFEFYATSTSQIVRMVASSTATVEGGDGVMMLAYGACP